MKQTILLFLLFSSAALLISSCDDAGILTNKNNLNFSFNGLRTLNPQVDGVYEAWVSIGEGDHGDDSYVSLGRFNISSTGALVDTAGNPAQLNVNRISDINLTEDALITIEPPGDNDTLPGIKMLGGAKTTEQGVLVFNMTMGYSEILPVSSQFQTSLGKYLLASPTEQFASFSYNKGLWFSLDTNGTQPGLTLPQIPDTAEWTYQAWLLDIRDSSLYSLGRFNNPAGADDNQQCGGPNPGWNLPGHDWIQANCPPGTPGIDNLTNFNFYIAISLEPKFETSGLALPFYLGLFYHNVQSSGFGNTQTMANVTSLPTAQIRLSANN